MPALEVVGGIVYLLMGGDLLVRGAVALSRRFRVAPVIVAFTVVAFGTSVPELVVGMRAAATGFSGITFGNVVGSNIANVLLVIGATAVVHPLATTDRSGRRDAVIMLAGTLLMAVLVWVAPLRWPAALILLAALAVATGISAREALRTRIDVDTTTTVDWVLGVPTSLRMIGLFLLAGLVGLPLGARLVVDGSVDIAQALGVPETTIGLTLVAVSTSLPELATTVTAAVQRRTELVLGTAVGSNMFNALGIMGASILVSPGPIDPTGRSVLLDLPVMVLTAVLLTVLVRRGRPIGRGLGAGLLLIYAIYLVSFA